MCLPDESMLNNMCLSVWLHLGKAYVKSIATAIGCLDCLLLGVQVTVTTVLPFLLHYSVKFSYVGDCKDCDSLCLALLQVPRGIV